MILAACLLVLFSIIASTDGFYFHIYRYRLHTRPASYREHLLHTINVCLFVPQVLLMFCVRPTGVWLWATVVLAVVILAVEISDVFAEDDSRRDLGGLKPPEYVMHFLMSGLRMGFLCAFYVARPPSDYCLRRWPFRQALWACRTCCCYKRARIPSSRRHPPSAGIFRG